MILGSFLADPIIFKNGKIRKLSGKFICVLTTANSFLWWAERVESLDSLCSHCISITVRGTAGDKSTKNSAVRTSEKPLLHERNKKTGKNYQNQLSQNSGN